MVHRLAVRNVQRGGARHVDGAGSCVGPLETERRSVGQVKGFGGRHGDSAVQDQRAFIEVKLKRKRARAFTMRDDQRSFAGFVHLASLVVVDPFVQIDGFSRRDLQRGAGRIRSDRLEAHVFSDFQLSAVYVKDRASQTGGGVGKDEGPVAGFLNVFAVCRG